MPTIIPRLRLPMGLTRIASRLPLLRLMPRAAVLTLFQPEVAGLRWVAGAGVNAFWMGQFEPEQVRAFAGVLRPGGIVYDIGAHAGFYSLLASRLLGERGQVIAFEPLPRNIAMLRRHLALNGVSNVHIIAAAVADQAGQARFSTARSSTMGRLNPAGTLTVAVVQLDALVAASDIPPPDVIKLDVEEAELQVLQGAKAVLTAHHPALFVSTHSADLHAACHRFLTGLHYTVTDMAAGTPARASARDCAPNGLFAHWEP